MGLHGARQGRQPSQKSKPSSSSKPAAKGKGKGKAVKRSGAPGASAAPLDVYSYSSSLKRPRGDVDPESRPQKALPKSKGKGKGRAQDDEDDEEESDDSSDGSGDELELGGKKLSGLYMGGNGSDDGGVATEDDEEIDSDEAELDDEDLPAKPKKGKGKASHTDRSAEIDMDEDEVDPDDEAGDGYMNLEELLDGGEYASDDSEEDSDDEEIDSDEAMSGDATSDDEEYAGALEKLNSYVEQLESKKRPAEDDESGKGQRKKRVVLKERTEAWPEGEFVAVSAPDGVQPDKVNLDDLLASFAGSKNPRLAALRKSLKPLVAASSASASTSNSHLKASGPLAAPLPARLQDKIEREAAYEKTKEETDKWNETVRRMKGQSGLGVEGARHERLTLPLMGGAGDVARDPNAAEWSAKFQPTNALEQSIQTLLSSGQMQASDLQKAEKAALASLDPADVAARQAELRQQRDLLFRAERKAKRVSKIKSKAFRRIHRRAKGKGEAGLSLEDMAELDRIDGGDRVTEEKARMEIARARERVTLKHSTKGGRWAKSVGGIEGLDEERNTQVREMVARGEQLRKRIAGVDSGDENDEFASSGSDDDAEDDDADFDGIRGTAFDELAALDAKDRAAKEAGPQMKGVLGMKFMKDAIARGERKTQGEADDLRRRLEAMDEAAAASEDEDDAAPAAVSAQVQGNLGRMVFGPSGTAQPDDESTPPTALKSTQHTTKLSGPLAISSSHLPTRSPLSLSAPAAEENPWLALDASSSTGKVSRKMNKATTGKDSRDASRSAAKVDRHKSKLGDAREAEKDDAQVEIDPDVVLARAKAPQAPQLTTSAVMTVAKAGKASTVATGGEDDDSSDEDGEEQHDAQRGRGPAAFKQRELVAKAFAGDDVVADFEAEKRREIERDAPKEEDNTLPGWGAWSGKGVKKQRNAKKFITKIPGIAPTDRKDADYSNVIISEKKDKKAAKYKLKDLPFPYTSAAQHDHKLRTPLGAEWSTATVLRDQTIPKVLIKPGVTIRPVDKKI
ncbi:hypothetical protein RQP46_008983 [Phenoliferia psychrophenolica]